MACRIGMATDPEERIAYWMKKEGHTDSEILADGLTYEEAEEREDEEGRKRHCHYAGGGERVEGPVWSVYHVWGGSIE